MTISWNDLRMLPVFGVFPKIGCNFATESSPVYINLKSLTDMKCNWIFGTLGIVVLLAPPCLVPSGCPKTISLIID